jgi:HAD superfamily hydrolase (TIGR01509 family)
VTPASFPAPAAVEGVLFDFHSTLVDQGAPEVWLRAGWRAAGRAGDPEAGLGGEGLAQVVAFLDRIWEGARVIDPDSRRDVDPVEHRAVFDALIETVPLLGHELAEALYDTMLDMWWAYDDAVPTLKALRDKGIRTALVSNIGVDVRPVLERAGLAGLLDAVVLSCDIGAVKPDPAIFTHALELIGVRPERALMVGDSWRDDGGAAQVGTRVLLLPRTRGPVHGLDAVLRLVASS